MEIIRVLIKNTRQKVAGSLNTKIPKSTLPTAPIPVQTAYAVPMGNSLVTLTNKSMLMDKQNKNPTYHDHMVIPVVSLALPRQVAKATSNNPAMIRRIQFTSFFCFLFFQR